MKMQEGRGGRFKGAEDADVRGRRNPMLGEAEMGGREGKRGTVRLEAVDSFRGEGVDSTVGVKNFSPFVSV